MVNRSQMPGGTYLAFLYAPGFWRRPANARHAGELRLPPIRVVKERSNASHTI